MASSDNDDKSKMFKSAIRCVNGSIDFRKLAEIMGVVNAEAMRKRFKRAFDGDEEGSLNMVGSQIGDANASGSAPKRTPKTPRTANKKRKTEEEDNGDEDAEQAGEARFGDEAGKAANGASENPKKAKAKATPRSPKTPKTPRTPKTPKLIKDDQDTATADSSAVAGHGEGDAMEEVKTEADQNTEMNLNSNLDNVEA